MKLWTVTLLLVMISLLAFGQEAETPSDSSVAVAAVSEDTLLYGHSVPSSVEYIPGNDDPDLVRDRLHCIQGAVPLTYNDKVHAFINYFTVKDREYTRMVAQRASLYFPLFEKYLHKYGLPDELKYLSIIESGLNPHAISRARAVGLWQFVSSTGRHYGLDNSWFYDDRMDPDKSTRAACLCLRDLYNMFGDWELAITAYNTGPGNVKRAIRRSGYKKTFWEIYPYLYRETRSYLPQYVAIVYTMNYLDDYNFYDIQPDMALASDTVHVHGFVNLNTLSQLTGGCIDDIQKLNPSILRNATSPFRDDQILYLPHEVKKAIETSSIDILDSAAHTGQAEFEALAKNAVGNTYGREQVIYRVRSGDVLGSIAMRYHVRVADIKEWNRLSGNIIRVGQHLNIWVLPSQHQETAVASSSSHSSEPAVTVNPSDLIYVVQPGDTLWDISQKFEGLTIERLKTLNKLTSNKIHPGQKLIVGI